MKTKFDNINPSVIMQVIKTGSLASLDPDQQEYYSLMEMVRGLRAKWVHNGKVITKGTIIKMLKSEPYDLSDYEARVLYNDSLNFFYAQENIKSEAFANLYAEKLEKMSDAAFLNGKEEVAGKLLDLAAKLRGCYKPKDNTIPEELLHHPVMLVYTSDISDTGIPAADRKQLSEMLDSIPDIPVIVRDNIDQDAGIKKMDILSRMQNDIKEFTEDRQD